MPDERPGESTGRAPGALASARCGNHDQVLAVDVCQRCGSFICGDCVELRGTEILCTRCHLRQGGHSPASFRALAALILGILGLPCGFIPGLIGLVLAYQELRRIDAGSSPKVGRAAARGAKVLGWINLGLLLIAILIAIAALMLRFR